MAALVAACRGSATNKLGGDKLCVTVWSKGFLHNSPTICSVSLRPVRTQAFLSLNPGPAGVSQWSSSSRSVQPVPFHGKVKKSVVHRMSATVTSTEPQVPASNVTIKKLEEEVWEGCSLQHGEMNADGVKIHYVEAGDPTGKLVVLLHGFPNHWFVWRSQFQPLVEAGYHVVAPDLRGYNLSSKFETTKDYGRSAVLPDIEKLVDNFGAGKPAIMVGHDWGAIIAWAFAEDYPSKVEKLVATNMGRLNDFQRILSSNFQQLLRSWYIGFFQLSFIPEWYFTDSLMNYVKNCKSSSPGVTDEDIKRMVEALSQPGSALGSISYYRAAFQGLWNRPDGTVPVISIPVTTLWGDKDAYLLAKVADTDKAKAPKIKLLHLPESGHWPMLDEPAVFNQLLIEAISGDGE